MQINLSEIVLGFSKDVDVCFCEVFIRFLTKTRTCRITEWLEFSWDDIFEFPEWQGNFTGFNTKINTIRVDNEDYCRKYRLNIFLKNILFKLNDNPSDNNLYRTQNYQLLPCWFKNKLSRPLKPFHNRQVLISQVYDLILNNLSE